MWNNVLSNAAGAVIVALIGLLAYSLRAKTKEDSAEQIEERASREEDKFRLIVRVELAEFENRLISKLNGTYIRAEMCQLREQNLLARIEQLENRS